MSKKYAIETTMLTKTYGKQTVVNAVNLHVPNGHIYGLLGRNGAGKTSIMKMILRLSLPTSGSVALFGHPVTKKDKETFHRIGAIIETPGFYPNLTGTENLEIFAKLRGTTRSDAVDSALRLVGLPCNDKKLFGNYSLGMKQRLGIANAVMHDPELLILDEPINGLDPIGIAEVREFLRNLSVKEGKTILISSHILSEIAMLVDDVGIMDHGVLLEESTMAELKTKSREYISFQVSDTAKAALLLERHFGLQMGDYGIQDEALLHVYKTGLDTAAMIKVLLDNNVSVSSSYLCQDTLEDYFKKITGGEGIA